MDQETKYGARPIGAGAGRRIAAEMRAYWEDLRGSRIVPARSDIDPRGIERALEFAFILERVAPGMGRFRLAGMHLNDLMGMEVRGMPLSCLFTPEGRRRCAELTEQVFSGPSIVEAELDAETAIGRPTMRARLLILPLASDFGDVTRALGCLVAEGDIGRSPRRFSVARSRVSPLISDPVTITDALPIPGLSESKLPFSAAPRKSPAEHLAEMTPEERRAMFRVVREKN